jgi:hypothetical protein
MSFRRPLALLLLWSASAAVIAAEPGACGAARETANKVQTELGPGSSAQAGQAAAAFLSGDFKLAAWAGLAAAQAAWNAKTVTDAGVYLHYADRTAAALQLLTCAHALGSRSPYLFEALAAVHKALGNAGAARGAIAEAQRLAPGDPLIELEAALIETGKPPPPAKPDANDALGRCIAALERHSQRVLAVRKQNHLRHDRLQNADHRQKAFEGEPQIHRDLIQGVRQTASLARSSREPIQHNSALGQCAAAYFMLTGFLLDSYYFAESAFELVFWADALGLDAPVFVRDLPCGSPGNVCDERGSPTHSLLSRQVEDRRHFGREQATRQYRRDIDACNAIKGDSRACRLRAQARECAANKVLIEQWAAAREQRLNTASRNFDGEARYVVSLAEGEIRAAREFAVALLRDMRKGPGNAFEMGVQMLNQTYVLLLLQSHLLAGGKVEQFLGDQKRWFGQQRQGIEGGILGAKQSHDQMCEPVMLELRLLQLEERYQAYLEHLRERMGWGVDSRVDTKFPCSFAIGGLSGKADLDDLGESKFAYEISRGPYAGSVEVGKDGPSFSGSASGKVRGVGVGVDSDGAAGASGRYGPFAGKADASFTSAVNPWNGRQYVGIRLRGSAGFGIGNKSGSASASCYPSSGEVTIYPRALLEDVGRYLGAKSR